MNDDDSRKVSEPHRATMQRWKTIPKTIDACERNKECNLSVTRERQREIKWRSKKILCDGFQPPYVGMCSQAAR